MAPTPTPASWRDARDFQENAADLRLALMEAVARWVPSPVRLTPQGLVEPADQSVVDQLAIAFDTLASPVWEVTVQVPETFVAAGVQVIQWARVLLLIEQVGEENVLPEALRPALRELEAKGPTALAWSVAERKDEDVREGLRTLYPGRAMKLSLGEFEHFCDAFPEAPFLADAPVLAKVSVPATPLPTVLGVPLKQAMRLSMWSDLVLCQDQLLGCLRGRWINVSQTSWGDQVRQELSTQGLAQSFTATTVRDGMITLSDADDMPRFRYCAYLTEKGPLLSLRQVAKAPPPRAWVGQVEEAPLNIIPI